MKRLYTLFLVLVTFACTDEDSGTSNGSLSAKIACLKCNRSSSEMRWLSDYIETTASQGETKGNIYAVQYDVIGTLIIHQPFIMSCGGCIQFDCAGNRRQPYIQNVWSRMNESTLIYAPN